MSQLPFAQLDLPGRLALPDGRYLVRPAGDAAEADDQPDVLVLRTLGARRAGSRLRRGKPVPLDAEPGPDPLSLARATLIRARPLPDEEAAERWLERISNDADLARGLATETTRTLNRALQAYRVAAPDPYAADVHPDAAVAIRFGYGTGAEVANGRWTAARELPEGRRSSMRRELLDGVGAQERIAGVLGGRDAVSPAEALLDAARRAASENRLAEAAVTLGACLEAAGREGTDVAEILPRSERARERALSTGKADAEELRELLAASRRALAR